MSMSSLTDKSGQDDARLPRVMVWAVLALCILPVLLYWAGMDFSSFPLLDPNGEVFDEPLEDLGSFFHGLSEWTSTCIALFAALLAFLYIYQKRDPLVLVIGVTMLLVGILEAAHTFASHELKDVVADRASLIPLTWALSRLGKAWFLGAGAALLIWKQPGFRRVGLGSLLGFGVLGGVVFYFVTLSWTGDGLALETYPADSLIKRPWDVPPLIAFLGSGLYLFPLLRLIHPGILSHALMVSVAPDVASQLHVVFGSSRLYDSHFNISHFLEIVGLSVPLIALALHFVHAYRRELTATERLEKAVGGLQREAHQRKQVEKRLRSKEVRLNQLAENIVTGQKEAEAALQRVETRNQALLSAIPDLIFRWNREGVYLDYHATDEDQLAFPPGDFLGKKHSELFPEQGERAEQAVRAALETGSVQTFEYRLEFQNEPHVYESRIVKSGEDEVLVMVRDITDQKHLEKEILEISSREQQRIGHDLHDGLSQQLAGIALLSKVLHQRLEAKSLTEASDARRIVDLVNDTIAQTRNLARGLSPVQLEEQGLLAALEELALGVENFHSVSCRFRCADKILIEDHATATHLYRIAQEAVNNALRHAEPSKIDIELKRSNEHCTLTVRDNGKGIADDLAGGDGMGFHIMQYRARMIDASLDIRRAPKGGTMVVCKLTNESVESKVGAG